MAPGAHDALDGRADKHVAQDALAVSPHDHEVDRPLRGGLYHDFERIARPHQDLRLRTARFCHLSAQQLLGLARRGGDQGRRLIVVDHVKHDELGLESARKDLAPANRTLGARRQVGDNQEPFYGHRCAATVGTDVPLCLSQRGPSVQASLSFSVHEGIDRAGAALAQAHRGKCRDVIPIDLVVGLSSPGHPARHVP